MAWPGSNGPSAQQIIIDAELGPDDGTRMPVRLRGLGKEGLINRKPTRTVTDPPLDRHHAATARPHLAAWRSARYVRGRVTHATT